VAIIVVEDLGFGDFGCYGSSIATPNIDALAESGLRYNNFHVTPICSPTRACLLTGRNAHAVGIGSIPDSGAGGEWFLPDQPDEFPGYTGRIPRSASTLARTLRDGGYNTFAVGKWHLTPGPDESPAGPFDHWPLGMGFERYYGFLRGMTDQWTPELVRDNGFVEPPCSPEEGYHLTEDLASEAIQMIQDRQQAATAKPFFLYLATGAMHSPHQVPSKWIDGYAGQFDEGWDVIRRRTLLRQQELGVVPAATLMSERPERVPSWDVLSREERRMFARQMEVYAAFLTHTDAQIGRIIEFLDQIGELENTIVLVQSDHGTDVHAPPPSGFLDHFLDINDSASMLARVDEFGGFRGTNYYAPGWAWVSNTPFRPGKFLTWLGGVRVPLIAHWPAGIPTGETGQVRSQFCHAIDVMPTIVDAVGAELPDEIDGVPQQPLDGKSMLGTFGDPDCRSPRDLQYFATTSSQAIYHDGWKATRDAEPSSSGLLSGGDFDNVSWSLHDLGNDFAEVHDLAASHPDRLQEMIELWELEATRNHDFPDFYAKPRSSVASSPPSRRRDFALPHRTAIETVSPFVEGFRVSAEIGLPEDRDAEGVVCAQHLRFSAVHSYAVWACYFVEGRLCFTLNVAGTPRTNVVSDRPSAGRHELEVALAPAGDAEFGSRLMLDGSTVAEGAAVGNLSRIARAAVGILIVGRDQGFSTSDDYRPPFPFNGSIDCLAFEAGSDVVRFARPVGVSSSTK
jgi:arylsulfatase A-like enzyme